MFPGVTVPQAEAGKAAAAGGLLSVGAGLLGPVGLGLGLASQSGLLGSSGGETSSAVSGGTFTTGAFGSGKSVTSETLTTGIIIAAIVLGFFLILKKGK